MGSQFEFSFLGELQTLIDSTGGAVASLADSLVGFLKGRARSGGIPGNPKYALGSRHARRRRGKSLQTGYVDLAFTGRMLGAMQVLEGEGVMLNPKGRGSRFQNQKGQFVEESSPRVSIGFSDPWTSYLATVHTAGYYGPATRGNYPRPFMELDDIMVSESMDVFGDTLYKMKPTQERIVINIM